MTRRSRSRRGYTMVIVVLFVTLFLTLWASATRQIGTMLRIEQARSKRISQEKQTLPATRAMSQGLAALEFGFPPSGFYSCLVFVDGNPFLLNFNRQTETTWALTASPGGDAPQLEVSAFQAIPPTIITP